MPVVTAIAVSGLLSGCMGSDEDASQAAVPTEKRPKLALIAEADFEKLDTDSVERALVEYWSQAQFGAWVQVVPTYDQGLRDAVGGDARLTEVLKAQADYFRAAAPVLMITSKVQSTGLTNTAYTVREPDGGASPRSLTWARVGSRWQIVYDSFLDAALNTYAQTRAQEDIDPLAEEPSEKAIAAGRLASRLQSRWLEGFLRRDAPSAPGG